MRRIRPTDTPDRAPHGRRAHIHARVGLTNMYYVMFRGGSGVPEPAHYSGIGVLTNGTPVWCTGEPELMAWWINP